MTNINHSIQLKSDRANKIRTGLYIEEPLLEEIKDIAERSGISVNESFILLIKEGIEANKQKPL